MKSAVLRRFAEASGFTVMRFAVVIDIAALLGIIGLIIVNAWPALSWEFLTEPPRDLMTKGGILPCILGTFCLAVGALVIALPLGVASAVYLHEYSRPSAWVTMTRLSIANLAGVPSIVFGLFGLTFFVVFCGFASSPASSRSRFSRFRSSSIRRRWPSRRFPRTGARRALRSAPREERRPSRWCFPMRSRASSRAPFWA